MLIDADYSQIEPRLMAHFSGDSKLCSIFHNDEDLYDGVSNVLQLPINKDSRRLSKILWLAIAYNAGAYKIAKTAKIQHKEAERFLYKMREEFKDLFYWKDKVIQQTSLQGTVRTLFGRQIPLSQEFAHLGPNYKVQGSASEIMKLALIATRDFNPVSTVHDEIIFDYTTARTHYSDINDAATDIRSLMEHVVELTVPLKVDIGVGRTWREAKGAS